jgi:hypothetical protein
MCPFCFSTPCETSPTELTTPLIPAVWVRKVHTILLQPKAQIRQGSIESCKISTILREIPVTILSPSRPISLNLATSEHQFLAEKAIFYKNFQ